MVEDNEAGDLPDKGNRTADSRRATSLPSGASTGITSDGGRSWFRRDAAVALVVGLVAALAGLGGNWIGARGAYSAAVAQQNASREAALDTESRTKRAEVYAAYLAAANDYELKNAKLIQDLERIRPSTDASKLDQNVLGDWLTARAKYQGAVNQVYVYGSDDAYALSAALAATLPPSVGSTITFKPVDEAAFNRAYLAFQARMRCEVPAMRVPDCR